MIRSLALASFTALAITAAPAAAAVAPGHVAFSVATKIPESNVDAGGAAAAVALPDGGAVMLAYDRTSRDVTVVERALMVRSSRRSAVAGSRESRSRPTSAAWRRSCASPMAG